MIILDPFRLVYTFGDASDPGNRHGSVVMQLFADGRVYVDNVFGGGFTRSWEGRTERATLERILAHLDEAGFPRVEEHPILPGTSLRVLLVQSGAAESHCPPIGWHAGPEMRGYGDAFRILDSMIAELTEAAIATVRLGEPGLVRRAETPSRPAVGLDEAYDLGFAPALVGVGLLARNAKVQSAILPGALDLGETIGRLLEKYGRSAPVPPADASAYEAWAREVGWAGEAIVSGLAAESFALGRAVGAVLLALEEVTRERMATAVTVLRTSRHAPAREIAALARQAPADFRARLEDLGKALRQALGA